MYQNTTNNPPENCDCGTAAEIASMGHNTGCMGFLHIHEMESYEVLLAILKKRKKVTFTDDAFIETKRPMTGFNSENWRQRWYQRWSTWSAESPKSKAKLNPICHKHQRMPSQVLADAALATSNTTQPNNPPKSLPDFVTETVDEADCPCEGNNEEMPPLEDTDF